MIFALTLVAVPLSSAASDGCPNTWSIDTSSSSGVQELLQAKQKYGSNMAMSDPKVEYSEWAGQLGPLPAPEIKWLSDENSFLYGKTKITTTYRVQLKDCSETVNFRFVRVWDERNFSQLDTAAFASNNNNAFLDFTYAASFAKCMQDKIIFLKKNFNANSKLSKNKWQVTWPTELQFPFYGGGSSSSKCGLLRDLMPVSLSPNCKQIVDVKGDPTNPSFVSFGPSVAIGSKCDYGFTTYVPLSENSKPLFGLFSLDASILKTTISCVNGKVVKKIVAVKPVCPKGFKKH